MAERQYTQQTKKTDNTSKQQTTPTQTAPQMRLPISHPAAIIQRARINPKSLTHSDVMQLQHTIGNRAVGRLLSEIGLNPSTAKQIQPVQMQTLPEAEEELLHGKMAEPIQRQEIPEEEKPLQGNIQHEKENRTGMPDNLKAGVENLSGINMSNVRVHYNSDKPAEVGALAYTQGSDIHIASRQEKHLPHEAWHVVQQAQGRVKPTMQLKDGIPVNDEVGLEREADVMGTKAFEMEQDVLRHHPQVLIQKQTDKKVVQRLFNIEFGVKEGIGNDIVTNVEYLRDSQETTGGPHITPNSLFVEQVKVVMLHKKFPEAYNKIKELVEINILKPDQVSPTRRSLHEEAMKVINEFRPIKAEDIHVQFHTQVLQNLARAYIRLRNSRVNAIVGELSGRKEAGEEKENVSKASAQKQLVDIREFTRESISNEEKGVAPPRKRAAKNPTTPLARAIIDWCDTGTVQTFRTAERYELLTRHLDDAIIALGIDRNEKVYTVTGVKDIIPLLKEAYFEVLKFEKVI